MHLCVFDTLFDENPLMAGFFVPAGLQPKMA